MFHIIRAALASGFCLFAYFESKAEPALFFNVEALRMPPVVPVVVFADHPGRCNFAVTLEGAFRRVVENAAGFSATAAR